jgi:hypothetical protein
MKAKRLIAALCLSLSLAGAFSIIGGGGGIDYCELDWVQSSSFWRWYFGCSDNPAGGGGSGAGD